MLEDHELVERAEEFQHTISDEKRDDYDGVTESGYGLFMVLLPGRTFHDFDGYFDEMDRIATGQRLLDPEDQSMYDWLVDVDRLTDGAVLVDGDGRIYPYTVEVEPGERYSDRYEEGWGTKHRNALNISAVDLESSRELERLREFPDAQFGAVDSTVSGELWEENEAYGDVVSIVVSSTTGEISVFDRGERAGGRGPIQEARERENVLERNYSGDIDPVTLEEKAENGVEIQEMLEPDSPVQAEPAVDD